MHAIYNRRMRNRSTWFSALVLAPLVAVAGCGPSADMTTAVAVTEVTTGWLDVGLDNLGRNKLVPAIEFSIENVSGGDLGMLQLNGVFRRCLVLYQGQEPPEAPVSPADDEEGTCLAEDQEWGGAPLIRAAGVDGLSPGDGLGPFTMESRLGYTGEQTLPEMLGHRDFVDVKLELYVKHRGRTVGQGARVSDRPAVAYAVAAGCPRDRFSAVARPPSRAARRGVDHRPPT